MLMMEFNQFSAISVPYLRNKENKKMLDQNKKAKQYQISNLYIFIILQNFSIDHIFPSTFKLLF